MILFVLSCAAMFLVGAITLFVLAFMDVATSKPTPQPPRPHTINGRCRHRHRSRQY